MSCIFNSFDGTCNMFEDDIEMPGCDDNGVCICDSDEDPGYTCEFFEEAG